MRLSPNYRIGFLEKRSLLSASCRTLLPSGVRGTVTDTSCEDVRGAFEDEHPMNMVDASDAYALSVFPFGRDDERPEDYES